MYFVFEKDPILHHLGLVLKSKRNSFTTKRLRSRISPSNENLNCLSLPTDVEHQILWKKYSARSCSSIVSFHFVKMILAELQLI